MAHDPVRTTAVESTETIGGVLTDLVEAAERMPVLPDQAEATAPHPGAAFRGDRRGGCHAAPGEVRGAGHELQGLERRLPRIRPGSRPPGMRSGGRPGAFASFHELV